MPNLATPDSTNKVGKKVSRVPLVTIASIMLLSNSGGALAQSQLVAKRICINEVGRIISSGDRYLAVGSEICLGDKINPVNGSTVKAVCYSSRQVLEFQQSAVFGVSGICTPPQFQAERRQCTPLNRDGCPKMKGPSEDQDSLKLITPYGNILLNTQPIISWRPVKNATSYTVEVASYGFHWETQVKDTILPYPQERKELEYGAAYTITVTANKGDSPINSSGKLVVHVLPEIDVKQVLEEVDVIKKSGLSDDEAAFLDLDIIYMSKGFLNATIDSLKARVAAGSKNPTLFRVLGDRYLDAWLLDEAFREYKMAEWLAKTSGNSNELAQVQSRLKLMKSQSQPPMRRKPAQ
jgi:hypothetical protein